MTIVIDHAQPLVDMLNFSDGYSTLHVQQTGIAQRLAATYEDVITVQLVRLGEIYPVIYDLQLWPSHSFQQHQPAGPRPIWTSVTSILDPCGRVCIPDLVVSNSYFIIRVVLIYISLFHPLQIKHPHGLWSNCLWFHPVSSSFILSTRVSGRCFRFC